MRLKNNSKGFTLIELLITVAIMLSILIISIVSITGVDKRKREEAYNKVVNTIETAAEQYINANEYKFENTNNTKIALKYLVENGFLNRVTNPITGKTIPECSYVTVNRKTNLNKVNLQITDFTISNDQNDCTILKSNGNGGDWKAPTISYKFMCSGKNVKAEKNGWFNRNTLKDANNNDCTLEAVLTIDKEDKYSADLYVNGTNKKTIEDVSKSFEYIDYDSFNSDGNKKATYEVKYKNSENKDSSVSIELSANIDTVAPTTPTIGLYKFNKNSDRPTSGKGLNSYTAGSWSNKNVFTNATSTDVTSGIAGYKYITTGTTTNSNGSGGSWRRIMANGKSTIKYMACDKAGNCSDYSVVQNVMIDKTAPTLNATLYKFKKNSEDPTNSSGLKEYTSGDWSNRYVLASASASDSLSGIDKDGVTYTVTGTTSAQAGTKGNMKTIKSEGTSTIKYKVCDVVGNCSETDAQTIKIDTQKPNATISLTSGDGDSINSGSHAHYKNMKYRITASDVKKDNSRSGIKEIRYIVENGLKTSKSFDDYVNTISSGTERWLLNFAGKKTVYAVAIDNAGNRGYAYAEGILDNDTVAVNQEKQQCKFTLSFSLLYAHESSQIYDGYEYTVWNVQNTNDTENKQFNSVKEKCGIAPPDNATFVRINGNESNKIDILTKSGNKKYYCFAVRPRKNKTSYVPKYDDLKWTVQRKHAISTGC